MKPLQPRWPTPVASFLVLCCACVLQCHAQLEWAAEDRNTQEEQSESDPTEVTQEKAPTCNCGCCSVAYRRPDEQREGKTDLKCVSDSASDKDTCPMQCELSVLDAEVVGNGETNMQFTEYYCFVQCKPITTEIGSKCTEMDSKEIKKAQTEDGTGEDIWATPEALEPPTVPPEPAPVPPWPKPDDEPLVIKEPEKEEESAAPAAPKEEGDAGAAEAKAEALSADAKVQAEIKKKEKATEVKATESEKFALEVRKVMEAPLSPNGFLVQVGIH